MAVSFYTGEITDTWGILLHDMKGTINTWGILLHDLKQKNGMIQMCELLWLLLFFF